MKKKLFQAGDIISQHAVLDPNYAVKYIHENKSLKLQLLNSLAGIGSFNSKQNLLVFPTGMSMYNMNKC